MYARSAGRKPCVVSFAFAFFRSIGRCAMLKSPQTTACLPPRAASSRSCYMRAVIASRKRYFCTSLMSSPSPPACTYTHATVTV